QEHIAAVKPCGDGLLLETLHYADEIVGASRLFASIEDEEVDNELLEVATTLIERKTSPFDAKAFTDNYSEAMRKLLDAKLKNRKVKRVSTEEDEPRPSGDNVVDLMAALKKSLEKSGSSSTAGKTSRAASSRPSTSKTTKSKTTSKATTKPSSRKKA